jgi:hypothetical protein
MKYCPRQTNNRGKYYLVFASHDVNSVLEGGDEVLKAVKTFDSILESRDEEFKAVNGNWTWWINSLPLLRVNTLKEFDFLEC